MRHVENNERRRLPAAGAATLPPLIDEIAAHAELVHIHEELPWVYAASVLATLTNSDYTAKPALGAWDMLFARTKI